MEHGINFRTKKEGNVVCVTCIIYIRTSIPLTSIDECKRLNNNLDNHSGFARLFPYRLSRKSTIYSLVLILIGEVGILEYELSKKTFCTGANSTPDRTRLPIGLQGVQVSLLARAQFHTVFRNVSTLREQKFYSRERRRPIVL